jgi:hypothetical protein
MVALADWRITPSFLQLEKLSGTLKLLSRPPLLLAELIAAALDTCDSSRVLTPICMELPCPITSEKELELGSMSTL